MVSGIHPIIQDTKADFSGLAKSGQVDGEYDDVSQPMSHFHSLFYDLFTVRDTFTPRVIHFADIISPI